jgi:hypothetical protein
MHDAAFDGSLLLQSGRRHPRHIIAAFYDLMNPKIMLRTADRVPAAVDIISALARCE